MFTGRSWAATTTEGLLIYSLDGSMVFDPYDLDLDVTPVSIRQQLRQQEWASAIILAFRLNEKALKQEVLETVPHDQSEWLHPLTVRIIKNSPDWCISFSSQRHLCLTSWYLRGEAPGLCGSVFREFRSPAVLHDVGSEPAHASWTESKEQVHEQLRLVSSLTCL